MTDLYRELDPEVAEVLAEWAALHDRQYEWPVPDNATTRK